MVTTISFAAKEGLQTIDQLDRLFIFLENLALLKVGQPLEPHLEDRLGLNV